MSKQTLNAKIRTVSGKTAAKKLRQVGSIPAVMYNEKGESTMLEVNEVEFKRKIGNVEILGKIDRLDRLD